MSETLSLVLESLPDLLSGARFTVLLSLGGMFFGLLLGFLLALGRLYARRPIQWLVRFYVSFFRGTPLLVQLFIIYYGLPEIGLQLDPLPAAIIGFSLNTAAYTCETLRAAIAQIDAGQWEAAASLGMNRRQTLRRIIVPQAARTALPPLGNSFIALVKDTSLAATIQVPELLRQSQLITAAPSRCLRCTSAPPSSTGPSPASCLPCRPGWSATPIARKHRNWAADTASHRNEDGTY